MTGRPYLGPHVPRCGNTRTRRLRRALPAGVLAQSEWVTRLFAVAVGIATTRVISIGVGALTTLSVREAFVVSLWAGFASSVVAGEIIIRRSRSHPIVQRRTATSALALVFAAPFALSAQGQLSNGDESAIRAARAQSNRAIAVHDTEGVVRLMLPEYVGVSSGNSRTIGRDAARANFAQLFASRPALVFVRTPRAITVNRAWGQAGESGRWTGTWSGPDGPIRVSGDYFAKWRKLGARWLLLTETFVQMTCAGGRYCKAPPLSIVQPPTPGLNHVYVGVDSATFAAMAASLFVRDELGAFETRVTTRADGSTYSGAYLYGRSTYVELQLPSTGSPADRAQLYLGSDAPGDIHKAVERLAAGFVRTSFGMNTRRRGDENVPWFHLAWIVPSASEPQGAQPFMMSVLEWHPDFLRLWFPDLPADSTGMSRAEYLGPLWKPGKYLRDVVGITFALDSAETTRMAERLAMLGYAIRRSADTVVAVGGGLTVASVPSSPGRHGTVALRFSLQRPIAGEKVRRIGTSELRFGDGLEATWTFR